MHIGVGYIHGAHQQLYNKPSPIVRLKSDTKLASYKQMKFKTNRKHFSTNLTKKVENNEFLICKLPQKMKISKPKYLYSKFSKSFNVPSTKGMLCHTGFLHARDII